MLNETTVHASANCNTLRLLEMAKGLLTGRSTARRLMAKVMSLQACMGMKKTKHLYGIIILYFILNAYGYYLISFYKASNLIGFPMFILYLLINIYFIIVATKNHNYFIFLLLLQWIINLLREFVVYFSAEITQYIMSISNVVNIGWQVFNFPNAPPIFYDRPFLHFLRIGICITFIFYTTMCAIKVSIYRRAARRLVPVKLYSIIIFYFLLNAYGYYLIAYDKAPNLIGVPMFILYLLINIYFVSEATRNNNYFIFLLVLHWIITLLREFAVYFLFPIMNYIITISNVVNTGWRVFYFRKPPLFFYGKPFFHALRIGICIIFLFYTIICAIKITICRRSTR